MAAADNPGVCGVVVGDSELPGHVPWQVKIYVGLVRRGLGAAHAAGMQVKVLRQGPLGTGGLFKDVATGDGEFRRLFLDVLRDPVVRAGQLALAETTDSSFTADLAAVHARIHCPTLCIWGTDDPFFPIAGARAMLPTFKGGARLTEIAGGKLFVHEDCADAFVVSVVEFLGTLLHRQAGQQAA
jgi:pimeloyl-ACP methyl ester carboxylesterase